MWGCYGRRKSVEGGEREIGDGEGTT